MAVMHPMLLALRQATAPMSTVALAEHAGCALQTANPILRTWERKGLVECVGRGGPRKSGLWRATMPSQAEIAHARAVLAMVERAESHAQ